MTTDSILITHFDSPLGPMIGGVTERGACLLEWIDRGGEERIHDRVRRRYRREVREGRSELLTQLVQECAKYFEGNLSAFTIPIDVTGTPFEMRTWEELQRIPYGVTCSYGQLAARLGKPGASRAVGRANGANYLAIIIPCHRVIESTGALRGYGGGLWRKQWLLDLESPQGTFAAKDGSFSGAARVLQRHP